MLLRADLLLETATTLILRNAFDRVVEVSIFYASCRC
jgi:hypothetical protein